MNAARNAGTHPRARITIAASSFADASAGVRLAALLSSRLEADLQGIFIEEEEQIALFGSPAARIVTAAGANLALPSPQELHAALKRDALAFEREIARVAARHARSWSFRTLQGRLVAQLGKLLGTTDIVLLGQRPLHRLRGPVIRLDGGSRPTIAANLAADLGAPLIDVVVAAPGTKANDKALTAASTEAALNLIGRTSASAIVVDTRSGPFRTPEQIRDLLEVARCPVILVGTPASG